MAKKTSSFTKHAMKQENGWEGEGGFQDLPELEGIFLISSMTVKESSSGFFGLSVGFTLVENLSDKGELEGQIQNQWYGFESEKGWNPYRVKKLFEDLKLELPEFEDVENTCEEITGNLYIQAEVKTTGQFTNIIIMDVLDDYEGEEKPSKKLPSDDDIEEMDEDDIDEAAGALGIKLKGKTEKKKRKEFSEAVEKLREEDEDEDEEDDDEESENDIPSEDDINDMDEDELDEVAKNLKIKLKGKTEKKKRKELIAAIEEMQENEDEEDEDEEDEDAQTKSKLLELAEEAEVEDIDEDMSLEEIVKAFKKVKLSEDDLDDEEIKLLKKVGLKKCIKSKNKK